MLDADPLGHGPDQLHVARAFSSRRGADHRQRLYVVEPAWTSTGAAADFRLPLASELIGEVGRLVANSLGADLSEAGLPEAARAFAEQVSRKLLASPGRAMVLCGEAQPAEFHALCHWINGRLHAPVDYLPSLDPTNISHAQHCLALAEDLHAGRVPALIVVDANPVYDSPDNLKMADAVRSVPFSAHLGLYRGETAQCCHWHLPASHALESWGDARAPDGTASLVQPLIQRLYDTHTRDEFLALLTHDPIRGAYDLTRETWRPMATGDFETWWRKALHDGIIAGTAATPVTVSAVRPPKLAEPKLGNGLTLVLSPDPAVWDGRFANNAWLQECPSPFTKQVWGNCIRLAPGDAAKLGIADEDTVDIELDGVTISAPAIVMEGQVEGTAASSWGQGHRAADNLLGAGVGERYCGLGSHPFPRVLHGMQLRKSAKVIPFRSTQSHTRLSGPAEELFHIATLAELAKTRSQPEALPPSLLKVPPKGEYAWAMVVDSDACIGCNACVVACQAENNVPIVGPEEVSQGRDMHWLRVDGYARPQGGVMRGFQPVPCMHCELAPCEPVCPVEASVHDHEGPNVQVYNRCIGTRFCEANCPYKVRRFNWFAYADGQSYAGLAPALKAQHDPDVSARPRRDGEM